MSCEQHSTRQEDLHGEVIATNRTVRLVCTLCAASGLFGLFVWFNEDESRAMRQYAAQSLALMLAHIVVGAILVISALLIGRVPVFGYAVQLVAWLLYIAFAIGLLILRVRMMSSAWKGNTFHIPLLERWVSRRA